MTKQGRAENLFTKLGEGVLNSFNLLTRPSPHITDANQRLVSRWLNTLLLLLVPLTLIGAFSAPQASSQKSSVSLLLFVISLTFVFVYVFNRRGHYFWAIAILLAALSSLPYFSWWSKSSFDQATFINSFFWILLPILLASLFLKLRGAVFTVVGHLAALSSLPIFFPELDRGTVADFLSILFPFSVVLLAANVLYHKNIRKIQEQSQQILVNEGKLQQLLQANPVVVYSAQASGTYPVTFISSNIAEQAGYYAEQFLSKPSFWKEHIHPDDLSAVKEGFSSLMKNGEHVHEYRFRHRDGSYHWMRDDQRLVRDASGKPLEIVGTWIDIHDRVEQEDALKSSEETFRSIAETNSLGILIVGESNEVRFANHTARELLFSGNGSGESILGEAFEYAREAERGTQITLPSSNGEGPRTARLISSKTDWQKEPASLVLVEDVTEKAKFEQALQDTQDLNIKIMASSSLGIAVYDASGQCVFANDALAKMVGANLAELQLQNYKQIASWKKSGLIAAADKTMKTGLEQRKAFSAQTSFGKEVSLDCRFIPVSQREEPHILLICDDVTEDLKMREALRDSEERYRGLAESAQDSIFVLDRNGYVEYVNPAAHELLSSATGEEMIGTPLYELFPKQEADSMMKALQSVFASGKTFSATSKFTFPDGEKWLDTSLVALPDADGDINAVMGVSRNITKRKEMEELSTRFGRVLENSLSEIYIFDAETFFFHQVNQAALENLGYSLKEMRAMTPLHIKPDFTPESFARMINPLRTGKLRTLRFETEHKRKDGSLYPVEVNLQLVSGESSPVFIAIILDISERKQAEDRIQTANRALRTLSAASQAVLFADQEDKLLEDVCRLISETGDYHLAWVGYPDQGEEKNVIPAAQHGYDEDYLEALNLSWGDNDRGQGPTGRAIRTGKTAKIEDIRNDAYFANWSEDVETKEYGACIAIPLKSADKVFGALTIFSKESKYFEPAEISLLEDLGNNLAYGINALRTKSKQERSRSFIESFNIIETHINTLDSPEKVLQTLGAELSEMGLTGVVTLLDPDGQTLRLEYVSMKKKSLARAEKLIGFEAKDFQIPVEKFPGADILIGQQRPTFLQSRRDSLLEFFPNLPRTILKKTLKLVGIEETTRGIDAPLLIQEEVNGILTLWGEDLREDDLPAVSVLANQVAIAFENARMLTDLQKSNVELEESYDRTLEGWSAALDLRDEEIEGHSQRVTQMTIRLAEALGLPKDEIAHIRRGALLHDIGKIGVPDSILLKPGPLNEEELKVMHQHTINSYKLLSPISYLEPALDIPYAHHERWDGSGYPRGLKGEEIPLAARIFAIVDVWDALQSDRPYRKAWPDKKIRKHLQDEAGKHFDCKIVDVFLKKVWT